MATSEWSPQGAAEAQVQEQLIAVPEQAASTAVGGPPWPLILSAIVALIALLAVASERDAAVLQSAIEQEIPNLRAEQAAWEAAQKKTDGSTSD